MAGTSVITLVCLSPGWVIHDLFVRMVRDLENTQFSKFAIDISEFPSAH